MHYAFLERRQKLPVNHQGPDLASTQTKKDHDLPIKVITLSPDLDLNANKFASNKPTSSKSNSKLQVPQNWADVSARFLREKEQWKAEKELYKAEDAHKNAEITRLTVENARLSAESDKMTDAYGRVVGENIRLKEENAQLKHEKVSSMLEAVIN